MAMFGELIDWIKKDKFNIGLTILCAIVSASIPDILSQYHFSGVGTDSSCLCVDKILTQFYGAMGKLLLVCLGLGYFAWRYRPVTLNDIKDKQSLEDYIEEECGIKQTNKTSEERAYHVVKQSTQQFFTAWLIIWILWIIFYGVDVMFYLYELFRQRQPDHLCLLCLSQQSGIPTWKDTAFPPALIELKYILDFVTSAALFSVYFILNNVTVDISDRSNDNSTSIFEVIVSCVILFGVLSILQILYLSYDARSYDIYTKILLGFFSTISFVLLLGKLNSNYLNIPRLLMGVLYIYAISQMFANLTDLRISNEVYRPVYDMLKGITPWIFAVGKAALLMAFSWILYKKRLIFYIIHMSLSITQNKAKQNKFIRYMTN